MTIFVLDPYVGALPVTFNMSPEDVAQIIGPPDSIDDHNTNELEERRGSVAIRYSNQDFKIVEVSFLPKVQLIYHGVDLFRKNYVIDFLSQYDRPFEFVGFVVYLGLGLAMTGFHDNDESQKAITVFRRGHWDEFQDRLRPL